VDQNVIDFAALIVARRLLDPAAVALALAAFLIFCALSGCRLSRQRRLAAGGVYPLTQAPRHPRRDGDAMGVVLRAVAGGLVIGVTVSDWLLACTIHRDIVAFWRSTTRICSIR
jgi:hypothetical protein